MYDFRQGFRLATDVQSGNAEAVRCLVLRSPTLAGALCGSPGDNGSLAVPAITIMVFLEGGRIKFCLRPKWGSAVAFGTIPGERPIEEELEAALQTGALEWRSIRGRASTGQGNGGGGIIPGQPPATPAVAKRKKHDRQ